LREVLIEGSSHDVYDVTCGSIIGMTIAYFSYRRYYPRLHASNCHEPYPSRAERFKEGFAKVKSDEEAGRSRNHDGSESDDD
jgi:diacylglycerol diphosphate phosphatase/phosphatidate phosphatase